MGGVEPCAIEAVDVAIHHDRGTASPGYDAEGFCDWERMIDGSHRI